MSNDIQEQNDLPSERDLLIARARDLGIGFSPNISVAKLKSRIEDKMASSTTANQSSGISDAARKDMYNDAHKLVRITVVNNNPSKKDWPGEIITVGNKVTGDIKRFVPMGVVTHVENMIYKRLKSRNYMHFITETNSKGVKVRKHRMMPEFGITVHEQLTKEELEQLGKDQRARNSID